MANVNSGTTDIVVSGRVVAPGDVYPDDLTDEQIAFFTLIGALAPATAPVRPQVVEPFEASAKVPDLKPPVKRKE